MTHDHDHTVFGRGDIAIIVCCTIWGLGTVLIKNVLGDTPDKMGAFVYNGLRLPIGVALMFSTELLQGRSVKIRREHVKIFAGLSFINVLNTISYLFGLKMTTAVNTGIIVATVPLFILLVAAVSGIDRPTPRVFVGVAIGFLGALAVAYKGGEIKINPGDLLIMNGCMLMGFFTVYSKRIVTVYSPMVTAGWVYLWLSIYQLPFFIIELPQVDWGAISSATWINFALSVIGPIYIGNSLYYYALHKIGPSRVGVYNYLTPVATLLFALVIGGEKATVVQAIGLLVVIIGVTVTKIGPSRRPPFRI